MPDREPLVDRVRAEYERRRQERARAAPAGAEIFPDGVAVPGGDPPLITRPMDWPPERPKEASMDEAATVTVGYEDGQVESENLEEHLKKMHRLPLDHYWSDEHLQRVHDQDHQGSGEYDYHAHPIDG